LCIVLTDSIK